MEGVDVDVGVIDMDRALETSLRMRSLHATTAAFPEVPAYSGGLMDSWPAWAVDALAVAKSELAAINLFYKHGGGHG